MDDLLFKVVSGENNKINYLKIWFSDNEPSDENNPGCIGIDVYDSSMKEIDGGELDYEDENIELKDMINDVLDFMKFKDVKSTTEIESPIWF